MTWMLGISQNVTTHRQYLCHMALVVHERKMPRVRNPDIKHISEIRHIIGKWVGTTEVCIRVFDADSNSRAYKQHTRCSVIIPHTHDNISQCISVWGVRETGETGVPCRAVRVCVYMWLCDLHTIASCVRSLRWSRGSQVCREEGVRVAVWSV